MGGYNDSGDLLDKSQLSGPIPVVSGVCLAGITPVELQRVVLVYSTGDPALLTHTVQPVWTTVVAFQLDQRLLNMTYSSHVSTHSPFN